MSIDGLDIRSCNRMDSVTKENTVDVSLDLNDHLGGLVLKEEQKLAVEALLSGKDVKAVLPTGFGKSIIYQSFVVAKNLAVSSSILVVVPLRSIIEDQLRFNDFGLKAVALEKNQQLLRAIGANKYHVILSAEFTALLKDESSEFKRNLSLIVVDECHTVETW